jgi:pimeloyl-ACP methyl ester carboxylesterase
MQAVVDSLMTEYTRAGKGKPVLVLHGWGDSSKGWQEFQKALAEDYDVIVVDVPGFGGTQAPEQTWGLDEYAAFVAEFLKKILVKPHAIIAHSNGGAVAVRGLAKDLLHTDKLVLLDSAGIRDQYSGRVKAIRLITKAGKALTMPLPKSVKKKLRRKVYKSVGSDMLVVERLQETFKRVVTDDVQRDAAILHVPTLLMYGEDDLATPKQYGRILHNLINNSQLETIPDAGHFVHLDKPAIVLEKVRKFMA